MPWTNANSSMIDAYDYDADMRVLHVRMRGGEIFSLKGVPAETAADLKAIAGNPYRCSPVDGSTPAE